MPSDFICRTETFEVQLNPICAEARLGTEFVFIMLIEI